jgi:hypothetical protein
LIAGIAHDLDAVIVTRNIDDVARQGLRTLVY